MYKTDNKSILKLKFIVERNNSIFCVFKRYPVTCVCVIKLAQATVVGDTDGSE